MKKSKKGVKLPFKRPRNDYIVYGILILILANALFYALTHVEGSTNYGDDPNYLYLASAVVHGSFQINPGYIFSVRLMSFMPVALFYAFFGITNLTSTAWNIISFLGIIVVAFYITRFFYDDKAALLAAFLASIFPLITKYAVTLSEDVSLTFLLSLAVLLFLYAERNKNRWQYLASGILFVASWLISYEASVIIAFILLYAFVEVTRKSIIIDKNSLFFLYGIGLAFLATFIFSYINSGMPFVTITTNLRFYSGVGTTVNGLPTIPTAETDLSFYINSMFQYKLLSLAMQSRGVGQAVASIGNTIFQENNPSAYGLYFYLIIPATAAVLWLNRRSSYFLVSWFVFAFLFLEFGPMHVGISLNPFQITYLLAHRIDRFLMVMAVPMCAVIGAALSHLVSSRRLPALPLGVGVLLVILAILYWNNYLISTFWYYWQYFPESLALQAANYLRPLVYNSTVYVEALYGNQGGVTFTGANLETYFGYPSDPRYFVVAKNFSCSSFVNMSYAVWSGPAPCSRFMNVLNITIPKYIPNFIVQEALPNQQYPPTNVYYAR